MAHREWRTLVCDVLQSLDGKEFDKGAFLDACSALAFERYGGRVAMRYGGGTVLHTMTAADVKTGRRFAYIGEKVSPWLLKAGAVGRRSYLADAGTVTTGLPLYTRWEMNLVPWRGVLRVRYTPTWGRESFNGPSESARSSLAMKVCLIPDAVERLRHAGGEELRAMADAGAGTVCGDWLMERFGDDEAAFAFGERCAADPEYAAMFAHWFGYGFVTPPL